MFVGESSLNITGYSTISRELLPRLHKTGKYELAEMATYAKVGDDRLNNQPWKMYPIMPADGDKESWAQYNATQDGQFGRWCFEKNLLDFKPDIVADYRDPYHFLFEALSPLRPYYSLLWMPTVDAYPQTDDWCNQFTMADGILTYTDFGYRTLKRQCGDTINLLGVASPGASFDDMKVLDKKEVRAKYGLPEDITIFGMVARNQLRKDYPGLFQCFRKFLDIAPKEMADKTFLHVHTGYPDAGWDIPKLLKEDGLSHKVYFTYVCRACAKVTVNKWNDYFLPCNRCGNKAVFFTNPSFGISRKTLCEIYNLYDLYIQYVFLEGFGIPAVEAAACGVPIATVPYSAMEDFVEKLDAFKIPIARMVTESVCHREWAHPDNNKFAEILATYDLFKPNMLKIWGQKTRELCEKHYDWDKLAKIWEDAIDKMPEPQRKWSDPKRVFEEKPISQGLDDSAFIKECYNNIAYSPHLAKGYLHKMFLKSLYTSQVPGPNGSLTYFGRENIINECKATQQAVVYWESQRCQ